MITQLKTHVALNVSDVEESVKFYSAMFGVDPVKLKPGYAKFDIANPPLNLTLNFAGEIKGQGALNHLGVQVPGTEHVLEAKQRLERAGLATFDEMNTDCCYALQDKVWVTDPNGYRWEIFFVKVGDTRPDISMAPVQIHSGQAAATGCAVEPQPAEAADLASAVKSPCCGSQVVG
jgi:catechol 2,3-dioxygenase-like lactoylglutathione lyase family enzyme